MREFLAWVLIVALYAALIFGHLWLERDNCGRYEDIQ